MRENKFRRWIKKEIETEAEALEQQVEANEELSSVRMPDDSYADLMKRIEAREKSSAAPAPKAFHIRRRTLLAVALVAILLAAVGVGASGERLFSPTVESRMEDGEYNVEILSGDEEIYLEVTEEEAYDEIEERLGILALRLGYKPKGMELENAYIDETTGEVQMEFYYGDDSLKIYMNKQSSNATFDAQLDGEIVDVIEAFYYDKELKILKIDGNTKDSFFATRFEHGNAYYQVTAELELAVFEEIVRGIFFENV